jgi:hypothetical protein
LRKVVNAAAIKVRGIAVIAVAENVRKLNLSTTIKNSIPFAFKTSISSMLILIKETIAGIV